MALTASQYQLLAQPPIRSRLNDWIDHADLTVGWPLEKGHGQPIDPDLDPAMIKSDLVYFGYDPENSGYVFLTDLGATLANMIWAEQVTDRDNDDPGILSDRENDDPGDYFDFKRRISWEDAAIAKMI